MFSNSSLSIWTRLLQSVSCQTGACLKPLSSPIHLECICPIPVCTKNTAVPFSKCTVFKCMFPSCFSRESEAAFPFLSLSRNTCVAFRHFVTFVWGHVQSAVPVTNSCVNIKPSQKKTQLVSWFHWQQYTALEGCLFCPSACCSTHLAVQGQSWQLQLATRRQPVTPG